MAADAAAVEALIDQTFRPSRLAKTAERVAGLCCDVREARRGG